MKILVLALVIGLAACGSAQARSTPPTSQELPAACQKSGVYQEALRIVKEGVTDPPQASKDIRNASQDVLTCIYSVHTGPPPTIARVP